MDINFTQEVRNITYAIFKYYSILPKDIAKNTCKDIIHNADIGKFWRRRLNIINDTLYMIGGFYDKNN